jgi:hypothetical protein
MKVIRIVTAIIFIVCPITLIGQSLIGVYGGFNRSFFNSYSPEGVIATVNLNSKNTYLFGFNYKERKDQLVNLTLGLDYLYRTLNMNYSWDFPEAGGSGNLNLIVNTINLRILPEIRFGKKIGFYINAGPFFGFMIKNNYSGTTINQGVSNNIWYSETVPVNSNYSGLEFGLCSSIGVEIPIVRNIYFLTEVSYSLGLNNIFNTDIDNNIGEIRSINMYITAGLAYKLNDFSITKYLRRSNIYMN